MDSLDFAVIVLFIFCWLVLLCVLFLCYGVRGRHALWEVLRLLGPFFGMGGTFSASLLGSVARS